MPPLVCLLPADIPVGFLGVNHILYLIGKQTTDFIKVSTILRARKDRHSSRAIPEGGHRLWEIIPSASATQQLSLPYRS